MVYLPFVVLVKERITERLSLAEPRARTTIHLLRLEVVLFPFSRCDAVFFKYGQYVWDPQCREAFVETRMTMNLTILYSSSLEVVLGFFTFGFHGTIRNPNAASIARRHVDRSFR